MQNIIAVLAAIVMAARGHHLCRDSADCETLGGLVCVRSMCPWGVCGCLRGYAARFVGSESNFQCVPIRKVGETCSPRGEAGVCGADNSYCSRHGVCTCRPNHEARWGGEVCLLNKTAFVGESCSSALGMQCYDNRVGVTAGGCMSGLAWDASLYDNIPPPTWYPATLQQVWARVPNSPLDDTPSTCSCGPGSRVSLPNTPSTTGFVGRKAPTCVINVVGDLCLSDRDCTRVRMPAVGGLSWTVGGAVCTDNKCTCRETSHVPDITGSYCAPGLAAGATCSYYGNMNNATWGVCDGARGLRCGDPCQTTTFEWDTSAGGGNLTCVCDPGWEGTTTCTRRTVGATCHGDYNCRSMAENAVCLGGECRAGGVRARGLGLLLGAALLVARTLTRAALAGV